MNFLDRSITGIDPFASLVDGLLAGVAIRLQLPPSLQRLAVLRYEAVRRHIERKGSPLHGLVVRFYPQGSMAIRATISARGTDGEWDLDIICELLLDPDTDPQTVLDLLYDALKDYPTLKAVVRHTRCISIRFADGMHLDITPSVRLLSPNERESLIFHANPDKLSERCAPKVNSYGFGVWYNDRTPEEQRFAEAYGRRYLEVFADAEVDDIPDDCPFAVKHTATVALQLMKRSRNIDYANDAGRPPPSVILSENAGACAAPDMKLSDMLLRQARNLAVALETAGRSGALLEVRNPIYDEERFTDRWPADRVQQSEYARRLRRLISRIEDIKAHDHSLAELQEKLKAIFGDQVVGRTVEDFNESQGRAIRGANQTYGSTGSIFTPAKPAIITGLGAAPLAAPARAHTFEGEIRK